MKCKTIAQYEKEREKWRKALDNEPEPPELRGQLVNAAGIPEGSDDVLLARVDTRYYVTIELEHSCYESGSFSKEQFSKIAEWATKIGFYAPKSAGGKK